MNDWLELATGRFDQKSKHLKKETVKVRVGSYIKTSQFI